MKKILLIWWFDTEDFVTPLADDPPKWVAEFFTSHGYKATFKMVGEKVRALEERHRRDVIDAIGKQQVGFHTNKHSAHPTVFEYLKGKTWQEGCREFERQEERGYKLIKEKFGRVVCYGHPGPSWTAEAYPVLRKWGVPVYLDSSSIIKLDGRPYWYCNILNLQIGESNFIRTDPELRDSRAFRRMKSRYLRICARLRKKGPGIASMLLHPHTMATTEYWDLNFTKGRNPKKGKYRVPPYRTPSDIGLRLERFLEFVSFTASQPNTFMINAIDAAEIFKDKAKGRIFNAREVAHLTSRIRGRVRYIETNGYCLAPSEILWLTVSALAEYQKRKRLPNNLKILPILGPSKRLETHGPIELSVHQFLQSSVAVRNQIKNRGQVPDMISVGRTILSPADYLATSARILRTLDAKQHLPSVIHVQKATPDCEKHVSAKAFETAFKWYVLPTGFKAPNLIEHAKLQSWTLKPAIVA